MTASLLDLDRDIQPVARSYPTIWGLDPIQLHDHFWAARGVSVVRLGERSELPRNAELYLLTDARTLAIFRLTTLIETIAWVQPSVMFLRLVSRRDDGYREKVITDRTGRFERFRRLYGGALPQLARVAITRDPRIAGAWQVASDPARAWRQLRREARSARRETGTVPARTYDRSSDRDLGNFVKDLVRIWKYPPATVARIQKQANNVWSFEQSQIDPQARFIGPVWVGAGRSVEPGSTVLGPAVLWDAPASQPGPQGVRWSELEPVAAVAAVAQRRDGSSSSGLLGKRLFDILFSLLVLLCTLPLYGLVMLAIWLEDGRPFFFAHRRQTLGGREFPCIKFRSMRKDADRIKAALARANQADGPQFFMADDPRLTRVGRLLRKLNIDELPQFLNVLRGDMSVVGPRPSPREENQFNPAWRDARLSVRAGVTGLWQVRRTRRPGLDFQEWIKYDIEYVQTMSWRLDLDIIYRTIRILTGGH